MFFSKSKSTWCPNGLLIGKKRFFSHQISRGDIVVFIDADLTGLNDSHLAKLTNPLILGKKEVVIGYPNDIKTDKLFLPLSGERAYWKKNLTPYLREMSKKGYGLELYLNYIFQYILWQIK